MAVFREKQTITLPGCIHSTQKTQQSQEVTLEIRLRIFP
jgi:hypothetical protein